MTTYIPIVTVILGTVLACILCGCSGEVTWSKGSETVDLRWKLPTTQDTAAGHQPTIDIDATSQSVEQPR